MRKINVLLITLVFFLIPAAGHAGENVYALQVDGLACPFCSYGIEKQLSSLEGVASVVVDIEKGSVVVTMQESASLDEKQARQAVKDAGFTLRSFKHRAPDDSDASDP